MPLERGLETLVEQEPERLADPAGGLVEVLRPQDMTEGWLGVVEGEDEEGQAVVFDVGTGSKGPQAEAVRPA